MTSQKKPNINVTLHVDDKAHGGSESWINVTGHGDGKSHVYSYRYTGGNHGGGHGTVVLYVDNKPGTIDVHLVHKNRYAILDIECTDPATQLTCSRESDNHWTIEDACTSESQAYYKVVVGDAQAKGMRIPCDPMIINQPK